MNLLTKTALTLALTLSTFANAQDSLIPYTSFDDAKGEVKEIYTQVKSAFGMLPAPIMQHSTNPESLKALWHQFGSMHNEKFSNQLQAMMRMTVASSNGLDCDYCIGFNEGMLINMFKMKMTEINAVKKDPKNATSLNKKDKKMLIFMVDAVRSPKKVNQAQVDELRSLGWSKKDIFDGVKMSTQMSAMTLLVDTLKIPRDF